ncbi:MAG: hypothetical protein R3D05_00340 [Dongiaceae bacterium]
MKSILLPRHDDAWISDMIISEATPEPAPPIDLLVEMSLPTTLHLASRLASQITARPSARTPTRSLRKLFKRWLRALIQKDVRKIISPQREFNVAIVKALATYIRSTEGRMLALEAEVGALSKELSAVKRERITDDRRP